MFTCHGKQPDFIPDVLAYMCIHLSVHQHIYTSNQSRFAINYKRSVHVIKPSQSINMYYRINNDLLMKHIQKHSRWYIRAIFDITNLKLKEILYHTMPITCHFDSRKIGNEDQKPFPWCQISDKLEQLERLRSEIPPAAPWLPILGTQIRSKVKTRQGQSNKFLKHCQKFICI